MGGGEGKGCCLLCYHRPQTKCAHTHTKEKTRRELMMLAPSTATTVHLLQCDQSSGVKMRTGLGQNARAVHKLSSKMRAKPNILRFIAFLLTNIFGQKGQNAPNSRKCAHSGHTDLLLLLLGQQTWRRRRGTGFDLSSGISTWLPM